jgi:WD40 repeat protein
MTRDRQGQDVREATGAHSRAVRRVVGIGIGLGLASVILVTSWLYHVVHPVSGRTSDPTGLPGPVSPRNPARIATHPRQVIALGFSPDGRTIASTDGSACVTLCDVRDNRVRREEIAADRELSLVAFSGDGTRLACATADGAILLWDVPGQKLAGRLSAGGEVAGLAFARDGRTLSAWSPGGPVRQWDCRSGKILRSLPWKGGPKSALAISADGGQVATLTPSDDDPDRSEGMVLTVRDTDSGKVLWSAVEPWLCRYYGIPVAFSPDGRVVAVGSVTNVRGSYDSSIRSWDVASGRELRRLPVAAYSFDAVTFTPDGRKLGLSYHSCEGEAICHVGVFDVENQAEEGFLRLWLPAPRQLSFSPDGEQLAVPVRNAVLLWSVREKREDGILGGKDSGAN